MTIHPCFVVLALSLLVLALTAGSGQALVLVAEGQPRACLVLAPTAAPEEQQAAAEITHFVRAISGAELPQVAATADYGSLSPIFLGTAIPDDLTARLTPPGTDPAAFVLAVDDRQACLRGRGPEGTLIAAYELLEQLGVRWFMPGDLGTVIPEAKTLTLKTQQTAQAPGFAGRYHNAYHYGKSEWGRRVRMGGPYFPSSHGITLGKQATFEQHPEYYALVRGQRADTQLCVSNPEVIRLAVDQLKTYFRAHPDEPWVGLGPNDGAGFCECEACRALDGGDYDAFSGEPSVTDRYVWFYNQCLKGLEDEFPTKKLCFYAYHTYMRPPVKTKPDPRIVPALAVIALCRMHGPDNPVCPEKSYWTWLAREWSKLLPEVYDRGYWFNLADPGFPFPMVGRLRTEIPLGHRLGIKGWRVETLHSWASETPAMYLAAKLMWDPQADVDALLDDFYTRFFGPAAKPMQQYLEVLDHAVETADHHTGSIWNIPDVYPEAVRCRARAALAQAARLAGKGVYGQRVAIFRQSFDFLEAMTAMMDHEARLDFGAAHADLQRLLAVQAQLLAADPPLLNPRSSPAYVKRFLSQPVEQGHARTTGGNRLVAGCADEWDFLTDPLGVGQDLRWFAPGAKGGNWQRLRTATATWSDQGLRYYKGAAWYRQTVTVPREFAGQRVFLWCGGVDEKAHVWVNGHEVGISHGASFLPFELDATEALRTGKNTLVFCVSNRTVDELGTGGITGPVMLYAPAAGPAAQLENVQELGRTFP